MASICAASAGADAASLMGVQSMVTRCCRRPDHWIRQTAIPLGAAPSIASITSGSRKARAIPPACSSNSWKSTLPELSIASTSSRSTPMSARPTAPLASRIAIARPGVALTGRLPKLTRQAPSGVASRSGATAARRRLGLRLRDYRSSVPESTLRGRRLRGCRQRQNSVQAPLPSSADRLRLATACGSDTSRTARALGRSGSGPPQVACPTFDHRASSRGLWGRNWGGCLQPPRAREAWWRAAGAGEPPRVRSRQRPRCRRSGA